MARTDFIRLVPFALWRTVTCSVDARQHGALCWRGFAQQCILGKTMLGDDAYE